MAPVIVLGIGLLLFRGLGALGVEALASWMADTRWALAVMFLFTASAHFTRMKEDLVRMIPKGIPNPLLFVYFTGVCEILGAVGLLLPMFQKAAGIGLIAFLLAVFPANVHAARTGATIGGRPATPLWLRLPIQLLFLALIVWSTQLIL